MRAMATAMPVPGDRVWVASLIAIVVLVATTFVLCGLDPKVVLRLVLGKDERASTSKFQAVAWTFAICFALLTVLFGHLIYGGFGWADFLHNGLNSDYLWLLGIPATGVVGAKAITQSQVQANPAAKVAKVTKSQDRVSSVITGVRELVSDDNDANPSPSLGDLQYVVFNIIGVGYFLIAFLGHVEGGLPTIPATLIALTGVSAGSYLANKAVTQTVAPTITSVVPSRLALGRSTRTIKVSGAGFMPSGVDGTPALTIGGVELHVNEEVSGTQLTAQVPTAAAAAAAGLENGTHPLVVVSSAGTPSATPMEVVVSGVPAPQH